MAWEVGTNPEDELKKRLAAFIEECFHGAYAERMPRRFIHVLDGNTRDKKSGVLVLLFTGADEAAPRAIVADEGTYQESALKVTIDVQADSKSGGGESVEAVFAVLQSIFVNRANITELIQRGIYNVRQSAEALQIDGVEWKRPLSFTCTVDVLL